jgi:hypothetical protein
MADDNTTRDDDKLRVRPMSACLDAIYFLTDARPDLGDNREVAL